MSAHTPGPWTCKVGVMGPYVNAETKTIRPHYVVNQTENFACPITTQDEAWANARLIAAAPELLDALRITVAALDDAGRRLDPDAYHHELDVAFAALAKAEGRTPPEAV